MVGIMWVLIVSAETHLMTNNLLIRRVNYYVDTIV